MNPIAWLYAKTKNNVFGKIMELIAYILGSAYTQALVNGAFSVYTALHFANNKGVTCFFIAISIIFFLCQICFIYLNSRQIRKKDEAESMAEVSRQLQALITTRMRKLDRKCEKFKSTDGEVMDTEVEGEADLICHSIHEMLVRKQNNDEIEIVLWDQHILDDGSTVAVPISYGTHDSNPPSWMNNEYSFSGDKRYRIIDCFEKNEPVILLTRKECQNSLVYADDEERENSKTCQYIALPIRKRDGFTSAVIQIRTFKEKVLPKDIDTVRHIINNWVSPFTVFYELALEEQNIIEEITI